MAINVLFVAPQGLLASVLVIGPIIDLIKAKTGAGKKKCNIDPGTQSKVRSVWICMVGLPPHFVRDPGP